MSNLKMLKQYIRIDTSKDDVLLKQFMKSAEQYLKYAGVTVGYENPLYCTAINMLVANWYDNRDIIGGKRYPFYAISKFRGISRQYQ